MPTVRVVFNDEDVMTVDLDKECHVVGRHEECDIHIDNLGVSRQHARFMRSGAFYYVEDLNSANGTFVNGDQVKRHNLNNGDVVGIGKYFLHYTEDGGSAPLDGAGPVDTALPGSANTMEMDSDNIRQRMEEMRNQSSTGSQPEAGSTADAEIKAREAEIEELRGSLKTTRILLVVAVLAAIGAIVGLILK